MPDERQEVRGIIAEVARAADRRLAVEVRELPGHERLQLVLPHGPHQPQTEVPLTPVLAAAESPMARNELRLRVKRATDTMLFKPMPDHRLADAKPVLPPGGQGAFRPPRGRGGPPREPRTGPPPLPPPGAPGR